MPISHYQIATKYNKVLTKKEQDALFERFYYLRKLLLNFGLLYLDTSDRKGLGAIADISGAVGELQRLYPEYQSTVRLGLDAKDKLVLHNYRLVIKQAKFNAEKGVDEEDLISAGIAGLTYALFKFNPAANTKFSSYGFMWVCEFMREAIREKDLIKHPPQSIKYLISSLSKMQDDEFTDIFDSSIPTESGSIVDDIFSMLDDDEIMLLCQCFPNLGSNTKHQKKPRSPLPLETQAKLDDIFAKVRSQVDSY